VGLMLLIPITFALVDLIVVVVFRLTRGYLKLVTVNLSRDKTQSYLLVNDFNRLDSRAD
jgi:hypothetical protein